MRIILDVGSCHRGEYDLAERALVEASKLGVGIKYQMLSAPGNNILTPWSWIPRLIEKAQKMGVPVGASVWSHNALDVLAGCQPTFIKIARSACQDVALIEHAVDTGIETIVSYGPMHTPCHGRITTLYCPGQHEADYPVEGMLDFTGLFPDRYHGFSDHTRGIHQTIAAIRAGAQIIEKHVKLVDGAPEVPDEIFAVSFSQIAELIKKEKLNEDRR